MKVRQDDKDPYILNVESKLILKNKGEKIMSLFKKKEEKKKLLLSMFC